VIKHRAGFVNNAFTGSGTFAHRVDPLTQPSFNYGIISVLMILRALFKLVTALRDRLPKPEAVADEV